MHTVEKFLSDYTPPTHDILSCELVFTISSESTIVKNTICLQKCNSSGGSIVLHGINLELIDISLDNRILSGAEYVVDVESITLHSIPETCTICITTKIYPEQNTALE